MRTIIVSVHDANPYFKKELRIIFTKLKEIKIDYFSLLITPNYKNRYNINKDKEFIKLIKKQKNAEIVLHGYDHKLFEFSKISYKKGIKKIKDGLKILNVHFKNVEGFVAPCWGLNKDTLRSIEDSKFKYTTDSFKIIKFPKKRISSIVYNFDFLRWYYNWLFIVYNSIKALFFRNNTVRFALHPEDVKRSYIGYEISIIKLFLNKGYKPKTYKQLINNI